MNTQKWLKSAAILFLAAILAGCGGGDGGDGGNGGGNGGGIGGGSGGGNSSGGNSPGDDNSPGGGGSSIAGFHRIEIRPGGILDIEFDDPNDQVINLVIGGQLVAFSKGQITSVTWEGTCADVTVPFNQTGTVQIRASSRDRGTISVLHQDGRRAFVNIDRVQAVSEDGVPVFVDRAAGNISYGFSSGETLSCAAGFVPSGGAAVVGGVSVSTSPVWRAFKQDTASHILVLAAERNLLSSNPDWRIERMLFQAPSCLAPGAVSVHRFFQPGEEHFFTAFEAEAVKTANDSRWENEGVQFCGFLSPVSGTIPVYRLFRDMEDGVVNEVNDNVGGRHLYATDLDELDDAMRRLNYQLEDVAFYAFPP